MPYLTSAASAEVEFPGSIAKGAKGVKAKRVQEWLCFHGCPTTIDADYGSATEAAVKLFQKKKELSASGSVNPSTWSALVSPLASALSATVPSGARFDRAVLRIAKSHLRERPIEIGGQNRGPWVRAYAGGREGPDYPWCAAFVSFVLAQTSDAIGAELPLAGSLSCDSLAYQAQQKERFVRGSLIASGTVPWNSLGDCQIFLVRHSATDWTHTGFSFAGDGSAFTSIEGNTDHNGSNNGYEVASLSRSLKAKDFVRLD